MQITPVDVLAIAAHRDDAELTCGGTLLKAAGQGYRTAILDLTQGEMGTRGSPEIRAAEASRAAEVLGLAARENLDLPDAAIVNDPPTRERLVRAIRRFRPTIVISPAREGRHPDHPVTAQLVRDACFLAGLAKVAGGVTESAKVKIQPNDLAVQEFKRLTESKLRAVRCYRSQFEGATQAGEVYPTGEPLEDVVRHHAAYYGALIRRLYGEPFFTTETMRVDDVLALEVSTF